MLGRRHQSISQAVSQIEKKFKNIFFKPGARPQPAEGRLWACAWFTVIVSVKVCVCVPIYLPIYLCLSVRTHVSKIV